MKKINLLTLISMLGVIASIGFIFFEFQVPNSIQKINSSLILEQEVKIENQNAVLVGLNKSKLKLTEEVESLNNEINILKADLVEISENLENKNYSKKNLDEEIDIKKEDLQKLDLDHTSTNLTLTQLKNEILELTEEKETTLSNKKDLKQIENELLEKEDQIRSLIDAKNTLEKNGSKLEADLVDKIALLEQANKKFNEAEGELILISKELKELKENVKLNEENISFQGVESEEQVDLNDSQTQELSFLDGLIVSLKGYLTYNDVTSEINFTTSNGVKIPIKQDEFAGALVGNCGLPISSSMEKRCLVNIEAEINSETGRYVLIGREIIDISKQ